MWDEGQEVTTGRHEDPEAGESDYNRIINEDRMRYSYPWGQECEVFNGGMAV